MKKQILILILVGGIAFFTYEFIIKQKSAINNINYQVSGYQVQSIAATSVKIAINIIITNPSLVSITLDQIDAYLTFEGSQVGTVKQASTSVIAANGVFPVQLLFDVNPQQVGLTAAGSLLELIQQKSFNFGIFGTIYAHSGIVHVTVPINVSQIVKL